MSSQSFEMQVRNDDENAKETKKPTLSSGKIFYKPGVIEEETDDTSVYNSSMVESPMLGMSYGGSGFLRPPQIHPSSSLHRIPTYSSSIGHSTVYRQDTCRNFPISPLNQLLATLRFYATNWTQTSIGDYCGLSTPTANKIVHRVSSAIAALHEEYIKFPETPQEISNQQKQFYKIARFPRVIGAMDCTHIRLTFVPLRLEVGGEQAETFRKRKGFYSINVQTICNPNLEIMDIVARWPGSTHDSTIFNNSVRKARFEAGHYGNALLVADGGYALKSYAMTPLENPRTQAEQLYNESQIRTRNPVERTYGVWKRRFPVLVFGMRLKLDKALVVIVATAVLHNMLRQRGEQLPPDDPELPLAAPWDEILQAGQIQNSESLQQSNGHVERNMLITNYFQSLL